MTVEMKQISYNIENNFHLFNPTIVNLPLLLGVVISRFELK